MIVGNSDLHMSEIQSPVFKSAIWEILFIDICLRRGLICCKVQDGFVMFCQQHTVPFSL